MIQTHRCLHLAVRANHEFLIIRLNRGIEGPEDENLVLEVGSMGMKSTEGIFRQVHGRDYPRDILIFLM